jgi:pyruvate dehydrogenase E1 component alpha subunit
MLKSRLFELDVARLWNEGKISGEIHLGVGEEAIAAGVVSQLWDGDAMALDHRGTPPLVVRGVDLVLLLREFLGRPDGLCGGMGGHMHLFSPEHLAASTGIAGAGGPAVVGFALAGQRLRPGSVAVAIFGEGAMNQGMLLEALNLAVVWKLPALFVCRDSEWAITTPSASLTGGSLVERARGFGMPAVEVDGTDVQAVWNAAREAIGRARRGEGPTYLHAHCVHLEGHLLDDPLLGIVRHPVRELVQMAGPLASSFLKPKGAPLKDRVASLRMIAATILKTAKDVSGFRQRDPVERVRQELLGLDAARLKELEEEVRQEIRQVVEAAVLPMEGERR